MTLTYAHKGIEKDLEESLYFSKEIKKSGTKRFETTSLTQASREQRQRPTVKKEKRG